MGLIKKLFGRPKLAKGYYFLQGDGTYYVAHVTKVYYNSDYKEWWAMLDSDNGKNVFNWPVSEIKADPVSEERYFRHTTNIIFKTNI